MNIGDTLPQLPFIATNGLHGQLCDLPLLSCPNASQKKHVLLYFYPKDNTPGCTNEAKDFRDLIPEFNHLNTAIFGISFDSLPTHEKFKTKWELPFELISDHDETIAKHFGVLREKLLFGRKYFGIIRSSFLFDQHGVLRQYWPKVNLKGHAEAVLTAVKNLTNQ